jgi:Flp pilus assembly protein TadD
MIRRTASIFLILLGCAQPEPKVDSTYDQAMVQFRAGRWQEAIAGFEQCLRQTPDNTEAQIRLGETYACMGDPARAREIMSQLPKSIRTRPEFGILEISILRAEGRHEDSLQRAQEVLASDPASVDVRYYLARLHLNAASTMDLHATRRLSEEILDMRPGDQEAMMMRLEVTLALGEFDLALEQADEFARIAPDEYKVHLLGGTAALWAGDARAVSWFQAAVDRSLGEYSDRLTALWLLDLAMAQTDSSPVLERRYQFPRAGARTSTGSLRFADVGRRAGVDHTDRGRGSAWLDYDDDGDEDLFTVGVHSVHGMYQNDGAGSFANVTAAAGLVDGRGGWGASSVDFDNDGDPDLYVTRDAWEGRAQNSLYRNDAGFFTDVGVSAGVADSGSSFTAAWADFDVDGILDLYVTDGILGDGGQNALFHGLETATFEDVATPAGVADPAKSLGTSAGDYDADGLHDIYVVNMGAPNRLYHNDGNLRFADQARSAGVEYPIEGGYVSLFTDFDNNGTLDLFVATMSAFGAALSSRVTGKAPELSRPFLYQNTGDGRFSDVTVEAGLDRAFGTMGIGVGDVDNDGFTDLYLSNGGPEMFRWEPNALYLNQGDGTFVEVAQSAGVDNLGKGHGATFADFDRDGDLDLYAGLGGHYDGDRWPNSLYENLGNDRHWIRVEARGTTGNRDAIGARFTLVGGAHRVMREVASGFGFGSSNSLVVHLGLGMLDRADSLEVRWPSGKRQVWLDPPVDCVLQVIEGQKELVVVRVNRKEEAGADGVH